MSDPAAETMPIPADNLLNDLGEAGDEDHPSAAVGTAVGVGGDKAAGEAIGGPVQEGMHQPESEQQEPSMAAAATEATTVEDLPPAPLEVVQEQQQQQPATISEQEAMATTTMVVDGLPAAPTLDNNNAKEQDDEEDDQDNDNDNEEDQDNENDNDNEDDQDDDDDESKKRDGDDNNNNDMDHPDAPPKKKMKKKSKKSAASYADAHYHRGGPLPSWNDMFFALLAFKSKLGTFNVPAQTKLGKWVMKQRQEYSKLQRKKIDYRHCSELSEERIQVLDSLGFIWDTMLHENGRRWNQRFEELKQWKDEHGHCNVRTYSLYYKLCVGTIRDINIIMIIIWFFYVRKSTLL